MGKLYVIDTETTGEAPPEAAVCELAAVPVTETGKVLASDSLSSLINPGHAIPVECRAVHHLSDADVAKAKTMKQAMDGPFKVLKTSTIVAHNMEFDRQFLDPYLEKNHRVICTYRCALHLYPEAPNHKNQTLRYYLGNEPPAALLKKLHPHRALYDAIVTAYILAHMMLEHSADALVGLTKAPVLLKTVRFGKHRGEPWADVPRDYLSWILSKDFDSDTMFTAQHWVNERRRT